MSFTATPLDGSSTPLPMSSAVPDGTNTPLAVEGGPSKSTGGNTLVPVATYQYDGYNVTQGQQADANTVNTVMGRLTKIRDIWLALLGQQVKSASISVTMASDQGNLGVSGTVTANVDATNSTHIANMDTATATTATQTTTTATNTGNTATVLGATTDAAVTGDNTGTASAKLRGLNKILFDMWDSTNHWLQVKVMNGNANGQATMANSSPVVIASDQTSVAMNLNQVAGATVPTIGSGSQPNVPLMNFGLWTGGTPNYLRDLGSVSYPSPDGIQNNTFVSGILKYTGGGNWSGPRAANIYKEVKAQAITAGTPVSVWTPTTGKSFRILGYILSLSVAGEILFEDTTGGAHEFWRTPALLAGAPFVSPQFDLGYLATAANNALFLDVSATGTVNGMVYGVEE